MALVEDTKMPKRCPNFSNWELVAMISIVSDNKILLLLLLLVYRPLEEHHL